MFWSSADFWAGWGIVALGTLAHFLYEWSGHRQVFAFFCAVNESTWEHIKLAFGPTFLWMLFQLAFCAGDNFALAKLAALVVSCTVMPLVFYGYRAITGRDIFWLDIVDFIISVFAGQYCSYLIMALPPLDAWTETVSIILMVVLYTGYLIHTVMPVKKGIARDPISNRYGISAHFAADTVLNKHKRG